MRMEEKSPIDVKERRYQPPDRIIITPSGIRGVVGKSLTIEVAIKFTEAFGIWLGKGSSVVVGRDTRNSSLMFSKAVISALLSVGVNVIDLDICPTPIILFYKREHHIDGAIIVTGSHNPPQYNGLKYLSRTNTFLGKEELKEIEPLFLDIENRRENYEVWLGLGRYSIERGAKEEYFNKLKGFLDLKLFSTSTSPQINRKSSAPNRNAGIKISRDNSKTDADHYDSDNDNLGKGRGKLKIVFDPGAGAGKNVTDLFLRKLNCEVITINDEFTNYPEFPRNIEPIKENLKDLSRKVVGTGADIGFAHDCDADRVAICDANGVIYPEDITVALIIKYLLEKNQVLHQKYGRPLLVTNSASSLIFEKLASQYGGKVIRTPVGERYLAIKMDQLLRARPNYYVFGGEGSSGGFMYPLFNNSRDGIFAAIVVCEILLHYQRPLDQLIKQLPKFYSLRKKISLDELFSSTKDNNNKKDNKDNNNKKDNKDNKDNKRDNKNIDDVLSLYKKYLEKKGVHYQVYDRDIKIVDADNDEWTLLHPSNTEPVLRIITEARTEERARELLEIADKELNSLI